MSHHHYRLSGLAVASAVPLPGGIPFVGGADVPVDVTIRIGDVPDRLDDPVHRGPEWFADDRHFLLNLPDVGRFLAVNGRELVICPAHGVDIADTLPFAIGSGFGAVLYQRGAFLLHGATVAHRGQAFTVCGPSGVGKSTLAAALCGMGDSFVADDISAVEWAGDGRPAVRGDGRMLRLCRDSVRYTGLENVMGDRVRRDVEKFLVPPPAERSDGVPLAAVYALCYADSTQEVRIEKVPPLIAAQVLLRQSYRRQLALAYSRQSALVQRTAMLIAQVPVYRYFRPRGLALAGEVARRLHDHWTEILG